MAPEADDQISSTHIPVSPQTTTSFDIAAAHAEQRSIHGVDKPSDDEKTKDGPNHGNSGDDAVSCCVICLDSVTDRCIAQPCAHAHFDFACLANWLAQRPTCPLCQATVTAVHYGFTAESESGSGSGFARYDANIDPDDARAEVTITFSVYRVPPRDTQAGNTVHHGSAATRPGPGPGAGAGAEIGVRVGGGPASRSGNTNTHQHQQRDRRQRHRDAFRPPATADEAIVRRRHVYRHQLYSLHVGASRVSRFRELTPAQFATMPHLVTRARLWIRRELQVFEWLSATNTNNSHDHEHDHGPGTTATTATAIATGAAESAARTEEERRQRRRVNNAEFLLEYIVAILKTVDMQGSAGQAEAMLADFLGRDNARLFLHELRAWLRSPHESLAAWDRGVQYPEVRRRIEVVDRDGDGDGDGDRGEGHHDHHRRHYYYYRAAGDGRSRETTGEEESGRRLSKDREQQRCMWDYEASGPESRRQSRGGGDSWRPSYSRKRRRRDYDDSDEAALRGRSIRR